MHVHQGNTQNQHGSAIDQNPLGRRRPAAVASDERVDLIGALDYLPFVKLQQAAALILSDSGGIQEEAPSYGKPVLVLREVTERPEGVEAGVAAVVGTREDGIVAEASRLLSDRAAYDRMATGKNPYGDGRASERIADALVEPRAAFEAGATAP